MNNKLKITFIIAAILLSLFLLAGYSDAAIPWDERYSSDYATDYYLHYAQGAIISSVTYCLIPDKWEWTETQKWLLSVGLAVGAKTLHEVFDTGSDYRDVVEVGLGAMIVIPLFYIEF